MHTNGCKFTSNSFACKVAQEFLYYVGRSFTVGTFVVCLIFKSHWGKNVTLSMSLVWFWYLLLLKISLNEHHAFFVKFFEALLCLCFLKTRGSTLDLKSEQKGLLWILDEESIFPGANDSSFLARLYVHHCNDSKFIFLQPFISSKRIAWALTAGSCFL